MLAPGDVFASNTATLPISGLASASAWPETFVGLHCFSPVRKMKLVEIIRGAQTDDETVARAFDVVTALGKLPIVSNDSRGFFTSRVFGTFVKEGATMLAEGIPAPLIEHAALAAGIPVGPLAVLHETSLGISVHVLDLTRADLAAEGKTHRAGRANCSSSALRLPAGRLEAALARAARELRESAAHAAIDRRAEAASALAPGHRDRALPDQRRAHEHLRGQHRLDLRHRLPGLDGWRDAVHRVGRARTFHRERQRRWQADSASVSRSRPRSPIASAASNEPPIHHPKGPACGAFPWAGRVHFNVMIQLTNCFASASVTCGLAGMGMLPHTPLPPLTTLPASLSTASF